VRISRSIPARPAAALDFIIGLVSGTDGGDDHGPAGFVHIVDEAPVAHPGGAAVAGHGDRLGKAGVIG
jgi:hypothetical protein